jgi:D-alanyl-D-alanine carboxypeptidase (penicillin-binding protein 5/6)
MRALLFWLLSAACFPLSAQPTVFPAPPAPDIAARVYLLYDYSSGQQLVARNPQQRVEPASLTKLMTAYVVFAALKQKRIRTEQLVTPSEHATRIEGSRMFIEPRKPVSVDDLIHGMVVQSGNDACIALAEAIAGSEDAFVGMMNREAQRLGLKGTHFANATGLSHPQHYSTAQDLVELAAAVVRDFPEYYAIYSQKEFRYNNIAQFNRNRLLWTDPSVDGMKTGYTENAGYCLIATARRGGRRLISAVLGAASETVRATESQKLLNFGFQAYDGIRLYAGKEPITTLQVYKGSSNAVKAGFLSDFHLSLPNGNRDKLKATIESLQPLLAPISVGQRVGTIRITLDGKPYREAPVVALEDVPVAGILGRGWDTLRLLFR